MVQAKADAKAILPEPRSVKKAVLSIQFYENQTQAVPHPALLRRGAGNWLLFQSGRGGWGGSGERGAWSVGRRGAWEPGAWTVGSTLRRSDALRSTPSVVAARRPAGRDRRGLPGRRASRQSHRRWRAIALRFPTARRGGHPRRLVAEFDRHPAKRDSERPFPRDGNRGWAAILDGGR